ncbi:MAG: GNAT family N-acetyltransferase [Proteobacteria bacterium]|jgi:GNAT superfamily N-acetyltransferase|nr:GNAT family N-acetyltransferase [Pseudomonadota bacterium]MCG6935963.1 GNAT family N-acetyltransferase [Pseudomonadota bacterium]
MQETIIPDTVFNSLEFEFSLKPHDDKALGQYVLEFEGKAKHWDDELAEERTVGKIRGHRIDLSTAQYDQVSLHELLDSVSSELSDFADAVMKDDRCILPETENHLHQEKECKCLVYISELIIDPGFRSHGLGSSLLQRMGGMIDVTDCLIALKAFPLADELGKSAEPAYIARVKRFYERNGFQHTEGEFMVKDARLCEAVKKRLAQSK